MEILNRARQSWTRFSTEAQMAIAKGIKKLLAQSEISRAYFGHVNLQGKKWGAEYTFRATKQIRILLNRLEGNRWEVVEFVRRSDKRIYDHSV